MKAKKHGLPLESLQACLHAEDTILPAHVPIFAPLNSLLPISPLPEPPIPGTLCQAYAILGLSPVAGSKRETGAQGW